MCIEPCVQKLVRVPSLVFFQLFGICFRFHRSEAVKGGGGAGSHNICGLLPSRILDERGGGRDEHFGIKGEVFLKRVEKTFWL
jgi:hypothetical protein